MADYVSIYTGAQLDKMIMSGSSVSGKIIDNTLVSGSLVSTGSFGYLNIVGGGSISASGVIVGSGKIILTDSDVAHGITNHIQTDAYGDLGPIHQTRGGLLVNGTSDQESADARSLTLRGLCNDTHTDTVPVVELNAAKRSGTSIQALADAETVLQVQNYTTVLASPMVRLPPITPSPTTFR